MQLFRSLFSNCRITGNTEVHTIDKPEKRQPIPLPPELLDLIANCLARWESHHLHDCKHIANSDLSDPLERRIFSKITLLTLNQLPEAAVAARVAARLPALEKLILQQQGIGEFNLPALRKFTTLQCITVAPSAKQLPGDLVYLECLPGLRRIDMLVQDNLSHTIHSSDEILDSMRTTHNAVAARLFSRLPHLIYVHIDRSIRLRAASPVLINAIIGAGAQETLVSPRYQTLLTLYESRTFQQVDFSVPPPPLPPPNSGRNVARVPIVQPVT